MAYSEVPATDWKTICSETPGEVKQQLTEKQLIDTLKVFKQQAFEDIASIFLDNKTLKFSLDKHHLGIFLAQIVRERQDYIGDTTSKTASKETKKQQAIKQAIEGIALHFTVKILFIKLIEDLARGPESPRTIHTLFPQSGYDHFGGLFGYKVLNGLKKPKDVQAMRLYLEATNYYKSLSQEIAKVTWQDIFRYGFNLNSARYGQLFRARNYDKFLPSETTLAEIRGRLIEVDIRTAVIYGSADKRSNVIGNIYERLIDSELRSGLGAIYTPDATMKMMVDLGARFLGGYRGKKIVEPACGSGHFYREIYRRYVDEVFLAFKTAHQEHDPAAAHKEALLHIYGRDIDPFAVQLTLLSTFLEQLKDNVGTIQGSRKLWSADRSVDTQNSLDPVTVDPSSDMGLEKTSDLSAARSRKRSAERAQYPDLVIGNPPYGVEVVPGPRYDTLYNLKSKDSYGYFIINAIERLNNGGRVIFIVSSSFLTIGTHVNLRRSILSKAKVIRVIKLHRATFPGIDIFPVILELERCDDPEKRNTNYYHFYDLWRLHPEKRKLELAAAYQAILADLEAEKPLPFPEHLVKRYTVRQGILSKYSQVPIFEGKPSLYEFMMDGTATGTSLDLIKTDGTTVEIIAEMIRGRQVVKMKSICEIKVGLQSGDNTKFYRSSKGVKGGAAKGGYKEVLVSQIVADARITALTDQQRTAGFRVDDPSSDAFYVPLDKAGNSDIDAGLLSLFWRPVEFYIDWSEQAVIAMRALHGKSGVFRNPQYYFKRGISFSNTGIYSPTYRLGHGGVFDQTGSSIFCEVIDYYVLLGLLCSTLLRYFEKAYINHGVHAQLEELPIVIPNEEEAAKIKDIVVKIIAGQKLSLKFDYRKHLAELDGIVNAIYCLDVAETDELKTWYRRHYPKLTGDDVEDDLS